MMKLFVWFLLAIGCASGDREITFNSDRGHSIRMKRFGCTNDERLTKNVSCAYKSGRNIFGIFSFEFTLLKPAHHILFQFDTYAKNSANRYVPTFIHMPMVDLCDIFKSKERVKASFQILSALYPPLLEKIGHLIHACPYAEGEILAVKNVTIQQILVPSVVATSDVKAVFRCSDSSNVTFVEFTFLVEVKGRSTIF